MSGLLYDVSEWYSKAFSWCIWIEEFVYVRLKARYVISRKDRRLRAYGYGSAVCNENLSFILWLG